MIIGERIKEARNYRNLSQLDLALELGISQGAIGQFERNLNLPSAPTIMALAKILKVTTDWLLGVDPVDHDSMRAEQVKMHGIAFVHQITSALNDNLLSPSQIALLSGMVTEFVQTRGGSAQSAFQHLSAVTSGPSNQESSV